MCRKIANTKGPKVKIIFIKEIIDNSYSKWKNNHSRWGSSLSKHINKIKKANEIKRKGNNKWESIIINGMLKNIEWTIQEEINRKIEIVIAFKKSSNNKNNTQLKTNTNDNKLNEIYGILYECINKKIKDIIGNRNNYYLIKFENRQDLIAKINDKTEIKDIVIINEILKRCKFKRPLKV